ncbi:hypothetical protein QI633_15335 [Nocardioides sp. QY071]|uniref:hypothetical protein n=1 Tax=Nocardioides sp. QY071 TaxID=3044187 RepID=UPI00249A75C1|nr:hypothetical protein [Nocardioides sp. QY071]WGX99911.1 hypothetical protein QI633_15335 [Nocardioides sp. QY071]
MATVRPGQDIEHLLTPSDHEAMRAAVDAAARGDARAAYEHEVEGLLVEGTVRPARLQELISLGEHGAGWPFARWTVDQAYRWMLLERDPRTDAAVRMVLDALHLEHVEALLDDPVALKEYGTMVAACDWVVQQIAVFDFGGLGDFLEVRAEPGLLGRADLVNEWRNAPMGAYAGRGTRGSALVLEDLATGDEIEVLNLGALAERDSDAFLLGRLVPISDPPYLMFESRPLEIDAETASDVVMLTRDSVDEGLGWLDALAMARLGGRLDRGFSCEERTLYLTDLTVMGSRKDGRYGDSPRVRDLRAQGYPAAVANAVGVIEVCLVGVSVDASVAGRAAPHLRAAFAVPGAHEAALKECTGSQWMSAWSTLAAAVDGQARERCVQLGELCRDAA